MRNIFFLIGILSLALLSSCGERSVEISPITPGYQSDLDGTSSAIKNTQAFEDCLRPSINMCISQVGNQLAREKNAPEFCNEIQDTESQNACKYGVAVSQALSTRDVSACDSLSSDYKNECRASFFLSEALDKMDIAKCDLIENQVFSNDAGGLLNRNEQCKLDVIRKNPNTSKKDCENMSTGALKQACIANFSIINP